MIKFTLIIWVCSFMGTPTPCLPPMEFPKTFNSWYDCSRSAHKESLLLMTKMGFKYINDNRLAIKYSCKEVSSI